MVHQLGREFPIAFVFTQCSVSGMSQHTMRVTRHNSLYRDGIPLQVQFQVISWRIYLSEADHNNEHKVRELTSPL